MLQTILRKVLGTKHEREMKRLRPLVAAINDLEPKIKSLTDAQLRGKTAEFRQRLSQGASLDDLLIEAFAVCREAGVRALKMRHFDVQLIGGIVLHRGRIAEMKTGEGKTLVATLAVYLNALEGHGVHVVTVNDYLAKRDSEWMGKLYGFLGLSTGVVVSQQGDTAKKQAYRCDVTYGQNNEFGFDYLRDNMKFSIYDYAQRELRYAIVDEVDSILIDEARTPLIISGRGQSASHKYAKINEIIPRLRRDEHYAVDEKHHSVTLSDDGVELSQRELFTRGLTEVENLYDPINLEALHILQQLLRAHTLYKRDQHYLVTEVGKVMIVDEFTGRVLPGRRWSDGLHQAVEAKENVEIQEENDTLATISFQNLFRLYDKLAGMTGTADTEAAEFHKIYKLDVVVIPTNEPCVRIDHNDLIYKTEREKFKAIADELEKCNQIGQPVLVGTTSVEKSEALAKILKRREIAHNVLNAKQHEREAYVVAQAGKKGAVTIATNMAGRGTDIVLGGNPEMIARWEVLQSAPPEVQADPAALAQAIAEATEHNRERCSQERKEVLASGGLHILGTERHEARRVDNQLRGRGGRQGDPGSSRFFLSLEDDLMRIFAGDRIQTLMDRLGMEEGVPIEHKLVTKAVENAQTKVEQRNFDIRKHLLDYDDVMNQQRKTVYALRRQVLKGQYRSEPNDEERKRGITPKPQIEAVDESLAEQATPLVEEMLRIYDAGSPPPQDGTSESLALWHQQALEKKLEQVKELAVEPLEQQVYVAFGCQIALEQVARDPQAARDLLRKEIGLSLSEQRERLLDLLSEIIATMVNHACHGRRDSDEWDLDGLAKGFYDQFGIQATGIDKFSNPDDLSAKLFSDAEGVLRRREIDTGRLLYLRLFRNFYLQEIDNLWLEHLQDMDGLREGIGLRGYGQRDPKKEYQKEGFDLFLDLMQNIKANVVHKMYHFVLEREDEVERLEEQRRKRSEAQQERIRMIHSDGGGGEQPNPEEEVGQSRRERRRAGVAPVKQQPIRRDKPKLGRNDLCWCGSGKKYKQCHLRKDQEQQGADF